MDSPWHNPSSDEIKEVLENTRTVAIVGLSSNPANSSYNVAEYLRKNRIKVIPVNPTVSEIQGLISYPDLKSLPEKPDIVVVFRKPEFAPEIVRKAIEFGATAVWLQEEIVSPAAFAEGRKAGLFMVMNKCIAKEHYRLLK